MLLNSFTANVNHIKLFNLSLALEQNKLGCFSVENIFIHFCDLGLWGSNSAHVSSCLRQNVLPGDKHSSLLWRQMDDKKGFHDKNKNVILKQILDEERKEKNAKITGVVFSKLLTKFLRSLIGLRGLIKISTQDFLS